MVGRPTPNKELKDGGLGLEEVKAPKAEFWMLATFCQLSQ